MKTRTSYPLPTVLEDVQILNVRMFPRHGRNCKENRQERTL